MTRMSATNFMNYHIRICKSVCRFGCPVIKYDNRVPGSRPVVEMVLHNMGTPTQEPVVISDSEVVDLGVSVIGNDKVIEKAVMASKSKFFCLLWVISSVGLFLMFHHLYVYLGGVCIDMPQVFSSSWARWTRYTLVILLKALITLFAAFYFLSIQLTQDKKNEDHSTNSHRKWK